MTIFSTSIPPRVAIRPLAMALVASLLVSACGGATGLGAVADVETSSAVADAGSSIVLAEAAAGTLFDSRSVHSIDLTIDEDAYREMLATYTSTAEKEWIEATVAIDGSTYEQVGIRLKGNSSLRGISSDSVPEELPWLIRLDKYVEGQNHEGYEDLVVRSNTTESALNEAVALELLGDAGIATEQAISIGFSVNGSDPVLRLVVEHPDDVWMTANFSADGALYKAESTGDYSYRGEDPEAYDEVFDQEAGEDNTDLAPLIDFLDFTKNVDDDTFAAELGDRLDVESFATYLAMMDLIDNFDDIDGPGNNSYLYYDVATDQFTVVPWDLNLAFGVRNDDGGPGGDLAPGVAPGGRPAGGPAAGGQPNAAQRGAGQPDIGGQPDAAQRGAGQAGAPNQGNILAERFLANPEFNSLYTQALERLESELFASGHVDEVLAEWVSVLETVPELIFESTLQDEASTVRELFS